MPRLPSAILETALSVAELARARDFYSKLFGYAVMKSDERFCAFDIGGEQVLLLFVRGSDPDGTVLPFGRIPPHGTSGAGHVGFRIPEESLAAWRSKLQEQGIRIESEFTWPDGGTSIYFRDPDGHLLELLTPGVWPNY
jgi:catechol 2,3-dioxygenase-like lactoylglutathione lyase family enzyme